MTEPILAPILAPIPMKCCRNCGNEYPATLEYFHKQRDGLRCECKACACARARLWNLTHKEHHRETARRYFNEHREQTKRYQDEWRREHAEELREYWRVHRLKNQDAKREYDRQYYQSHRQQAREYARRYYHEKPEGQAIRQRRYEQKHPEMRRAANHRRRARELSASGTHSAADIVLQKKAQTDKRGRLRCWWCGKVIKDKYHIDHVIPLSRGGTNAAENIVLTHSKCNQSKNDKLPSEWAGRLF